MAGNMWMRDPDSGGVKIDGDVKELTEKRIRRYAEANFSDQYTRLDIRFRSQFCYVDAFTEPEPPGPGWPPEGVSESREEYMERMRNTPWRLFRLRYFGNKQEWGLAFYSYSQNTYETSVFPGGDFFGTPEDAFQTAAEFHL